MGTIDGYSEQSCRSRGVIWPLGLTLILLAGCYDGRVVEKCADYFDSGDMGRFEIKDRELAYDPSTRLYWSRCSVGQKLNQDNCVGKAVTASLPEAFAYVEEISQKSSRKWRMPTNDELSSIMETRCINPAVNTNVFPDILVDNYWTSEKSPHQMSGMFRCAGYTYQGSVSCRVYSTDELPFLIVSDG